ncbi:helix-turn-helix domain-containing protein [Bacillus infantis]|uniref:helix-turn-helix domain-containing protein n=1 Tax=Bacillus infantis TaxID=324767 RepID=UPI003CF473A3
MDKEQILYIGSTIKRLRTEQKLSQEDLAGLTGYSREYISKVEQNHIDPSLGAGTASIAKALGLKTWELVKIAEDDTQLEEK